MPDSQYISNTNSRQKNIFERLLNGETILPNDPEIGKLIKESFAIKKWLIEFKS